MGGGTMRGHAIWLTFECGHRRVIEAADHPVVPEFFACRVCDEGHAPVWDDTLGNWMDMPIERTGA